MKQIAISRLNKFLVFICLALMPTILHAQAVAPPPTPPPYPKMYVETSTGQARRQEFLTGQSNNGMPSKYSLLKASLKAVETNSIYLTSQTIKTFVDNLGLADSLTIYFASYWLGSNVVFPANLGTHLTIIFAPVVKNHIRGDFYYINGDQILRIGVADKDSMILNYVNNKIPVLNITIPDVPRNRIGPNNKLSDTRGVTYALSSLKEMLGSEISYQSAKGRDIKGIEIDFASYTEAGADVPSGADQYRLILQFEYILVDDAGQHHILNIDQLGDARVRQVTEIIDKNNPKGTVRINSMDNGQLCPANCPVPLPPGS